MRRSATIEERRGRDGDPCGPRGEGLSLGNSAKLMEREGMGSSALAGQGEQGKMGLGSSMGEDEGDGDGEGEGEGEE